MCCGVSGRLFLGHRSDFFLFDGPARLDLLTCAYPCRPVGVVSLDSSSHYFPVRQGTESLCRTPPSGDITSIPYFYEWFFPVRSLEMEAGFCRVGGVVLPAYFAGILCPEVLGRNPLNDLGNAVGSVSS